MGLMDALGRGVDHLRISLTDKCNLDCFYCHKEGGESGGEEMRTEHVFNILDEAKNAGITTIKFTGGEPLLRADLFDIIKHAKSLGFEDVGLTTNGTLLENYAKGLKEAGLERINIGCDSLTGILPKNMLRLKKGIDAAIKAGLDVKLNMVVLSGINDHNIQDLLDFCREKKINLQLIELIEVEPDAYKKYFYSLAGWEEYLAKKANRVEIRDIQRRKRFYFENVFVETVRPNKQFCERCNKLRVTADGKLRPCLMKNTKIVDFEDRSSIKLAVEMRDSYGYG